MGLLEKLGFRSRHVNGMRMASTLSPEPVVEVLPVSVADVAPVEAAPTELAVRPADRIEEALRGLPMALDESASARHHEQVELLRTIIAEHRAAGDCLDTTLTRLAEQSEASLEARRELNASMEATRLALAEMVRASERTAQAVEQREAAGREAAAKLIEGMARTRRSSAVLMGLTLLCALASLGAAGAALAIALK
jgi:hypothetical protein